MTDDFLNFAWRVTDTMKTCLNELSNLEKHTVDFERGGLATLTLAVKDEVVFERFLQANCKGELAKELLRNEKKRLFSAFCECVNDLQTLIESEEN